MARIISKILLGFLSTAVFFATFILAGDVLIAATAAVAVAIVQFVFGLTTRAKPGVLMWASLAVVIVLTGLSLQDDDAFASLSPTLVNGKTSNCGCSMQSPRGAHTPSSPPHVSPRFPEPKVPRV